MKIKREKCNDRLAEKKGGKRIIAKTLNFYKNQMNVALLSSILELYVTVIMI